AFRHFELFTKNCDDSALNQNIRGSVYEIVLTYANTKKNTNKVKEVDIFKSIQKVYENAKTADQKVVTLKGLCFVQDENLIRDALNFSISDKVKPQDLDYAFYGAIDAFTSEEDAREIEMFFDDKSTDEIKRPLMQSLEGIRANANWLNHAKEDVPKWLKENNYM
ncbi:14820_t:CDS:2, partial [Acaulospora colombiana]